MEIQKYDIYFVDLNPKKGSAQAGLRPCVVIQSNAFNKYAQTFLLVPLTTNQKKLFPSEFLITPSKENGLQNESRFLGSQIITLDKKFFVNRLGSLEKNYHSLMKEALAISIDVEDDF